MVFIPLNMEEIVSTTVIVVSVFSSFACCLSFCTCPETLDIILLISKPTEVICNGYSLMASFSVSLIYALTPVLKAMINPIPIIPIDPAIATSKVLVSLVLKLLKDKDNAVRKDMELFPVFSVFTGVSSLMMYGLVSSSIFPSLIVTIRVAYCLARSGLCVTMTTSLSFATSFNRSITCTLVSESRAPVGSSAKTISGSLTRALAMATRCI